MQSSDNGVGTIGLKPWPGVIHGFPNAVVARNRNLLSIDMRCSCADIAGGGASPFAIPVDASRSRRRVDTGTGGSSVSGCNRMPGAAVHVPGWDDVVLPSNQPSTGVAKNLPATSLVARSSALAPLTNAVR